jgi:hypothetical protein
MLEQGEDWLLQNQEKLELRKVSRRAARPKEEEFIGITDDDVPF